ncbi:MFS transporter [Amycolatopsis balhimycina DSM 5908]|uniref:MFS transporter n=1 Tax=Amycolatopsis balhimycina DSM 5908 TaxID=1081091 RepID=A0A428WME4_AMYBA|nr:MFS transporter [Amycolatopsis balhimycina]RSM44256.1 MFS transporter [Amycolatopsis balhimycina DSM 5908]
MIDSQQSAVPPSPPAAAPTPAPALPKVSARYIWLMALAQFGVFLAFITPLGISLSVKVAQLAPGHEEYLGYITGAGAGTVLLFGPLLGVLSDRTRSKLGRRRPFMIGGMLLGVVSLVVMATAPSVFVLGFGWVLAQLGWGQVLGALTNSQADRLPEEQRGKVAGLVGFATLIAPVGGVVLASQFVGDALLLFLVPGSVGVVLVTLFVCLIHEQDSRTLPHGAPLTARSLAAKYTFKPRRYPDYSWNWLSRFLFYFGLTLNTTFVAFFLAARLGVSVAEVAGTVAALAGLGVLATSAGALGGGFLSDKLRRRRVFVLVAGAVFALGAVVMAFASSVPLLFAGSLTTSVGLGMFSAVDQALALDVLPERETEAGRFMGIMGFATSIPQSVAPLIAPVFLTIGATATGKNYTLLFIVAAACTVLSGLAVQRVKSVR